MDEINGFNSPREKLGKPGILLKIIVNRWWAVYNKSPPSSPVKSQIVNIFSFVGHILLLQLSNAAIVMQSRHRDYFIKWVWLSYNKFLPIKVGSKLNFACGLLFADPRSRIPEYMCALSCAILILKAIYFKVWSCLQFFCIIVDNYC